MIKHGVITEPCSKPLLFLSWYCSEEAEGLAKKLKLRFYRTSVKEDLNVNEGESMKTYTNDQLKNCYVRKNVMGNYLKKLHFFFSVFKYLADKYLQRLKRQTAEEPEAVHTAGNKIGKHPDNHAS